MLSRLWQSNSENNAFLETISGRPGEALWEPLVRPSITIRAGEYFNAGASVRKRWLDSVHHQSDCELQFASYIRAMTAVSEVSSKSERAAFVKQAFILEEDDRSVNSSWGAKVEGRGLNQNWISLELLPGIMSQMKCKWINAPDYIFKLLVELK